ncbi:MAG: hypothetical protein ACYTEO_19105, partial [Planctomycetota bacterium]
IQSQLPEGISVDMAEDMLERYGYSLSDIEPWLQNPMVQKFLTSGGNGPMQVQASPPPAYVPASQPQTGGRIPLDKLGT